MALALLRLQLGHDKQRFVKIIATIGMDVLDVHRLTHNALCGLTILTPVTCTLMHTANRLRPGQLTH